MLNHYYVNSGMFISFLHPDNKLSFQRFIFFLSNNTVYNLTTIKIINPKRITTMYPLICLIGKY